MIKLLLLGVAAASLASTIAQPMSGQGDTRAFITQAAQSDQFERQEGRLAEQRAANPRVRRFAAHMVVAHTQTTAGLKAAIRRAGMSPPPPPMLSGDQTRMINDLRARRGRDFDNTYVQQQIQAHQDALGLMQSYARNGPPGPIRDAARKTAPMVQDHLTMAQGLQGGMGR